jgi:hypothetical protein
MKVPVIFIGLAMALGTALWWNRELAGALGPRMDAHGFRCLVEIGTGDCQRLWFAGLHQTNQIASIVFYAGILMAVFGLFMSGQEPSDDRF